MQARHSAKPTRDLPFCSLASDASTKRVVSARKNRGHDPLRLFINHDYPRVMVPSHVLTLAGIAVPVNHVEVTFLVSV